MALFTPLAVGAVCAIVIPWYTTSQDTPIFGGLLDGRTAYLPIGSGTVLHWSWLVFAFATLAAWLLIRAAEQRG